MVRGRGERWVALERLRRVTVRVDPELAQVSWEPDPPEYFLHAFRGRADEVHALFPRSRAGREAADRLELALACDAGTGAYILPAVEGIPDDELARLAARHLGWMAWLRDLGADESPEATFVRTAAPRVECRASRETTPVDELLHEIVTGEGCPGGELAGLLWNPLYLLARRYELASWVTWPLHGDSGHDPFAAWFSLWSRGHVLSFDRDELGYVACVGPSTGRSEWRA